MSDAPEVGAFFGGLRMIWCAARRMRAFVLIVQHVACWTYRGTGTIGPGIGLGALPGLGTSAGSAPFAGGVATVGCADGGRAVVLI